MNRLLIISLCLIVGINLIDASDTGCHVKCFFECFFSGSPCKTENCPCPDQITNSTETGNATESAVDETATAPSELSGITKFLPSPSPNGTFSVEQFSQQSNGTGGSKYMSQGGKGGQPNATANGSAGSSGFDYSKYLSSSKSEDNNKTSSGGDFDYSQYTSQSGNGSSSGGSSKTYDYSQYTSQSGNKSSSGGSSGSYDYSQYTKGGQAGSAGAPGASGNSGAEKSSNTTSASEAFDYSEYNTPPATIPPIESPYNMSAYYEQPTAIPKH